MNDLQPSPESSFRWWYLPSWIGLDAPLVVSTWTCALLLNNGREINRISIAALFLTVWSIYLLDRMVDVARCRDWSNVTGRMRFGKQFQWLFVTCLSVAGLGLIWILFSRQLLSDVIYRALWVSAGMAVYLSIFVIPLFRRKRLRGKEIFVGLFFALGAASVTGFNSHSVLMFVGIWVVISFNCLVIAARDKQTDALTDPSAAGCWWSNIDRDLKWLGSLLLLIAICVAIGFAINRNGAFFTAIAGSIGLLLWLHFRARRLSSDAVRALADHCLFTPWVWFAIQFLR